MKLVLRARFKAKSEEKFNANKAVEAIWDGPAVKKILDKFKEKGPYTAEEAKIVSRKALEKLDSGFSSRYSEEEWDMIEPKLLAKIVKAIPVD
jgi:hypothetical protein